MCPTVPRRPALCHNPPVEQASPSFTAGRQPRRALGPSDPRWRRDQLVVRRPWCGSGRMWRSVGRSSPVSTLRYRFLPTPRSPCCGTTPPSTRGRSDRPSLGRLVSEDSAAHFIQLGAVRNRGEHPTNSANRQPIMRSLPACAHITLTSRSRSDPIRTAQSRNVPPPSRVHGRAFAHRRRTRTAPSRPTTAPAPKSPAAAPAPGRGAITTSV